MLCCGGHINYRCTVLYCALQVFDKKEEKETRTERLAKEEAARKALLGGDMLSPGGTSTEVAMEEAEAEPEEESAASTAAKRPRADGARPASPSLYLDRAHMLGDSACVLLVWDVAAGGEGEGEGAGGGAAAAMEEEEEVEGPVIKPPADAELPENVTGCYELYAILTHKGPGADGGHYVAYVRHSADVWCCFDDDKVTECRGSELPRKVDGGTAHNHMAYMLLYRTKSSLV